MAGDNGVTTRSIDHSAARPFRVAIVGAGLAGCAAAIALDRLPGIEVAVFERSEAHRQTGATIGVTISGQLILADLCGPSALPAVSTIRATTPHIKFKTGADISLPRIATQNKDDDVTLDSRGNGWTLAPGSESGGSTSASGTAGLSTKPKPPLSYASTTRCALHNLLVDGIPKERVNVEMGKRAIGYRYMSDHDKENISTEHPGPGATSVRVEFADGSTTETDLLVVADGINSRIRKQFRPSDMVTQSGTLEYTETFTLAALKEALSPDIFAKLPKTSTRWIDDGRSGDASRGSGMVFMGPTGPNAELFYVICILPELREQDKGVHLSWAQQGGKERIQYLQDKFRDWDPVVEAILGQMTDMSMFPVSRGSSLEHLYDGDRMCFIGDAAHPTGGAWGAGCSFAFGDVHALGLALSHVTKVGGSLHDERDLRRALHVYNETRRHFCRSVFQQLTRELDTGVSEDSEWLAVHDAEPEFAKAIGSCESQGLDYAKPLDLKGKIPLKDEVAEIFKRQGIMKTAPDA